MKRQKKSWEEVTNAERLHILPKEFDVFCIGDMVRDESEGDLNIPGNLYVSGSLDVFSITIRGGSLIVDESIDAADITVQDGSCICSGDVVVSNVFVSNGNFISARDIDVADITVQNGNFICDGNIDTCDITVPNGDCIVRHTIKSWLVNVKGTLDCYDIESNGYKICSSDYVCRRYEEENK